MCGRYGRRADKQRIAEWFHTHNTDVFNDEYYEIHSTRLAPSYNISPDSIQPVVRLDRDTGERVLAFMKWGLVPYWSKTPKANFSSINARSDKLESSGAWREPWKHRRCLIPANFFFEWEPLTKEEEKKKLSKPWAVSLAREGLFAFGGIWDRWKGLDMFLGLETMALSFYVMVGFLRREKRSNEAAMKYLLLGAFSTGILAYGFSLLYGLSSSTNIAEIGNILGRRFAYTSTHGIIDWLVILAFVTVAAGMFFKVAAVPFHQWAPDVYEGAPTPISAYVSVASKTASFAMLLRLMINVFGDSQTTWIYIISGVAIASLTWGNLAALTQTNMKRLLAYSSISHVGYILLGLVAWNETGLVGIMYYLIAYAFMTIGAFAVVIVMRQRGLIGDELEDLDGLYLRSPTAALLLLIFMLSLAGIPPTAGFVGKYFIFQALIESHHPVLAVFAALYIVPGLYYYFRVVVHAWMKKPGEAPAPHMSSAQAVALGAALFVTLAAGIYPEPFARLARYAFGP